MNSIFYTQIVEEEKTDRTANVLLFNLITMICFYSGNTKVKKMKLKSWTNIQWKLKFMKKIKSTDKINNLLLI